MSSLYTSQVVLDFIDMFWNGTHALQDIQVLLQFWFSHSRHQTFTRPHDQ
jgi:hypothetical protein